MIRRSLVGKKRLDATFTRRELDHRLRDLGERFLRLAAEGAAVPGDLAATVQEIRELEERLRMQMADIAALESES